MSAGTKSRLPKLTIKKFSGQPSSWQEFWDNFSSSIHENSGLNDIDRFVHLRSLVEGTAYDTIAGLALTAANYKVAVDLLKQRFGQRQLIINYHMENLMKITPLNSSADIKRVRRLHDNIEQNCRGLKALGVTSESYGALLVPVLLHKLPEDIRLEVSRKMGKTSEEENQWDLDKILKQFKDEIEAREHCTPMNVPGHSADHSYKKPVYNRTAPSTASALLSSSNRKSYSCTFCRGSHSTAECNVVTDIQERKNILKRQGRCFLCLRRGGHLAKNCTSNIKCFNCNLNHHVALCHKRYSGISEVKLPQVGSVSTSRHKAEPETVPTENTAATKTANNYVDCQDTFTVQTTLLQTAICVVSNPLCPERETKVRVLLDQGSQLSYITSQLKEKLNLPVLGKENMIIKTFGAGSNEDSITVCDVASMKIKNPKSGFLIDINLLTVSPFLFSTSGSSCKVGKRELSPFRKS